MMGIIEVLLPHRISVLTKGSVSVGPTSAVCMPAILVLLVI